MLVNGAPEWTTPTFAGRVRTHRIRIAGAGQLQLQAVRVPAAYQIWPAGEVDTVRAYYIADSIWQGSAMGPFLVGGWCSGSATC